MRRRHVVAVAGAGLMASAAAIAMAAIVPGTGAVAASAPGPRLVAVGQAAALPSGTVRLGALPAGHAVPVEVVLRPRHAAELAWLAEAVSEPGSPLRGHYLPAAALHAYIAPIRSTVRLVVAELRRAGLRVTGVSSDRMAIHATGTAAAVESAFHTSLVRIRTGGADAYVNTRAPRLPSGIATSVQTVLGLDSMRIYQPEGLVRLHLPARRGGAATVGSNATRPGASSSAGPTACSQAAAGEVFGSHTAPQLAEAYGMSALYAKGDLGQHINVAVVEFEPDTASDIAAYEKCYGVTTAVHYVPVDGGVPLGTSQSGEAALDIETIAGLAPDVTEYVYQAPSTGLYDVIHAIAARTAIKVVSMSWGACEQQIGPSSAGANAVQFEISAAEGQSWFVAAGDSGSTGCTNGSVPLDVLGVDDPASQPFVTGVGGTSLPSVTPFAAQSVWNAVGGAGGGGVSRFWSMPQFQQDAPSTLGVVNAESSPHPCAVPSGDCREVPDVSADANPKTGYIIYFHADGGWVPGIGGTSAAAPSWASLAALTDEYSGCGGRSIGFADPSLYAVAGGASYPKAFVDVRTGSNDLVSSGYTGGKYKAYKGYDMASGLGAPYGLGSDGAGLSVQLCKGLGSPAVGMDFVSPESGPTTGGTHVDVLGYGFSSATVTGVDFGTVKGTAVKVVNSGLIEVTSPAEKAGTVVVTVHSTRGTTRPVPGDRFTYP